MNATGLQAIYEQLCAGREVNMAIESGMSNPYYSASASDTYAAAGEFGSIGDVLAQVRQTGPCVAAVLT